MLIAKQSFEIRIDKFKEGESPNKGGNSKKITSEKKENYQPLNEIDIEQEVH